MKKYLLIMSSVLLIVFLSACGNNNDGHQTNETNGNNEENINNVEANEIDHNEGNNANDENDSNESNDTNAVEGLSAEEVYAKMVEANDSIESFSAVADIKQDMEVSGEVMNTSTSLDMDIVKDPIGIQQKVTTEIPGQGKQEMEAYMTEEGYYMFEPTENKWLKFPDSMSSQMLEQSMLQGNMEKQMEQFKGMEDDFILEENDDTYKLKFTAEDDEMNNKIIEMAQSNLPDEFASLGTDLFDAMSINEIMYEFNIDKSTFYVEKLDMVMDFTMEMEGQEIHSKQNMSTTYTGYNNIDKITIPQEVIDQAEDIEF